MRKVKWIWVYGEFEIYHHMLLHCRRVQQNYDFPTMWRVVRPELNADFFTSFLAKTGTVIRVVTHSKGMVCKCDTILNHTELYAVKNGTWLMHLRYGN